MAVVMVEGPTISDNAIQKQAVVFSIVLGAVGVTRKLSTGLIEVDADKTLIKAQKILMDCPEITAIQKLDGEIRRYVSARALPGPLKRGLDLLPIALLEETDAAMHSYAEQRQEAVNRLGAPTDAFPTLWDQRVAEAALRLRTAWSKRDYLSWEEAQRRYFFTWAYAHLANPDALLPPDIAKRNREQMDQMWTDTALGIQELLRGSLLDLVTHMEDRLSGQGENGKPKIFRDSAVTNIHDFLATFDARNITNDQSCAKLAARVKELLSQKNGDYWNPQVLRDSDKLRDEVRKGFKEIKHTLDQEIVRAPKRRQFNFDD